MDVQGHRGARGHLPENTLAGFELAMKMGVTTLELDVGVTKDGVVVIHHDRGLNPAIARGPDGKWVERAAPIHSLTFDELQRYDVGRLRPGSGNEGTQGDDQRLSSAAGAPGDGFGSQESQPRVIFRRTSAGCPSAPVFRRPRPISRCLDSGCAR